MTDPMHRLAARACDDPHFLAFALARYAEAGGTDLASRLGVGPDALAQLALCPAPRPDPAGFREDLDRLAAKFSADRDALAVVARHGQLLERLRKQVPPAGVEVFMAARDRGAGQ